MKHAVEGGLRPTLVAGVLSFSGAVAWAVHALLTAALPPFDGPPDWAIHAAMGVLKLAAIVLFPFAIRPLYEQLQGNVRKAGAFALFFVLGYLSLFALYILFGREALAAHTSDGVVRFYYLHSPALDEFHYIGLEEWRAQWARWIPQAKELVLMVVFLAALVGPGYFFGPRLWARVLSSVVLLAVCVLLPPAIGLVLWDYDTFLGGVFFDLLSLDLIPMLWWFVGGSSVVFFVLAATFYCYVFIFCYIVPQRRIDDGGMQSGELVDGE
ncbi:MAG: hypothetical protein KF886_03160 [Candidatus Hydrogenedentes bacterium]|nr:hypothetical protein [Candidatus Hydrogenedentota bacterium]